MTSPGHSASSKPTLAAEVAQTNAGFFFKEFSFSRTSFRPPEGTELELADHIVALGDRLIVSQLKERNEDPRAASDRKREKKWFDQKVLGVAMRQIRDTLRYLNDYPVAVVNERGRSMHLGHSESELPRRITKIVLYRAGRNLPSDCRAIKHHASSSAGIIHVLSCEDWVSILHTLVTPAEIIEYLDMREALLELYPNQCKAVPEHALVGQSLVDMPVSPPDPDFSEAVFRLKADYECFDITGILHSLGQKASLGSSPIPGEPLGLTNVERDYYPIMEGLARFGRSDCALLKERFMLCWQRCGQDMPFVSRFISSATGIGVLLFAIPQGWESRTAIGLYNLTEAHKYDRKLRQCIGISFARHGEDEERFISWMHLDSEWQSDPSLDVRLADAREFLPSLRVARLSTYSFEE